MTTSFRGLSLQTRKEHIMSFGALAAVSLISAMALTILIFYAPITSSFAGIKWSPRLTTIWFVPALDIGATLYLIVGDWFGLGHSSGIYMTVTSISTAFGLSCASFTIRKFLAPRWRRQHAENKSNRINRSKTIKYAYSRTN